MKSLIYSAIFLASLHFSSAGPLRIQKRAAFYIANETACVVDNIVYSNGDPIPTDDPCESCKCRPPGFACVLKDCEVKPGCRAVRKTGHCCPDYICGCEHNGRMYRDGDEIRDSKNPCYTCHCQGSSIACAFVDCFFRVDCPPEYTEGECCPHYTHCNETNPDEGRNPYVKENEPSVETTTLPSSDIVPGVSYVEETTQVPGKTTVIEIFEIKVNEPDATESEPAVNLYAINAEKPIENDDSSESIEESENKDVKSSIIGDQLSTVTTALTDSSSETSEEKSTSKSDTELREDTEIKAINDPAAELSDENSSTETVADNKETVEDSTKLAAVIEEFNSPVVVENVNVEPEEPSNTLELIDLPSDYGKSLRFPEQDVASNANETKPPAETPGTWKSILEETSTELPASDEPSTKVQVESSEATTGKQLYYSDDKALQTESVAEAVTTVVSVKELTQPSTNETLEVPSGSSIAENLFKSLNDEVEDEEKATTKIENKESSTKSNISVSDDKTQVTESSENKTQGNSKEQDVITTVDSQADLTTVKTSVD